MKYITLSTIASTISFVLIVYLVCRQKFIGQSKYNKVIYAASLSVLFIASAVAYVMFKKMHSTPKAVICLIVAFIFATAVVLFARHIQGLITEKVKNNDRS